MYNYDAYLEFKKKYPALNITLNDVIMLHLVLSSPPKELQEEVDYEFFATELQKQEFIKITDSQIILRPLGEELLGVNNKTGDLLILAEKMREMFPKGIKSGGYPIRSNVYDIADKLKKFMKKHNYSSEIILKATSQYLKRKEAEGWNFTQIAVYFIEKNGMSTLASECEGLIEGDESKESFSNMEQL